MRVFILEDDHTRISQFLGVLIGHEVDVATDITKASEVYKPPYDLMLLDHDLGLLQMVDSKEENTGSEFCRRLPEGNKPLIIVHSYNYDGAMNMIRILKGKGYIAMRMPFGPTLLRHLDMSSEDELTNMA